MALDITKEKGVPLEKQHLSWREALVSQEPTIGDSQTARMRDPKLFEEMANGARERGVTLSGI